MNTPHSTGASEPTTQAPVSKSNVAPECVVKETSGSAYKNQATPARPPKVMNWWSTKAIRPCIPSFGNAAACCGIAGWAIHAAFSPSTPRFVFEVFGVTFGLLFLIKAIEALSEGVRAARIATTSVAHESMPQDAIAALQDGNLE